MPAILGLRNKKLIRFHHQLHLGDCVYFLHFLRKFTKVNPGVTVEFYFNPRYAVELHEQNDDPHIRLIGSDPEGAVHNIANLWWQYRQMNYPNIPRNDPVVFSVYTEMYVWFFKFLCQKLGYVCPIQEPDDMVFDHPGILKPTPMSKPWDFLIINSYPRSKQVNGTEFEMDAIFGEKIAQLKAMGASLITTKKVSGVPCTRDHNLSLMGIANLSLNVRSVVGINTAPYIMCVNIWSLPKVERWVHLNDKHIYRYPRFVNVHTKEKFAATPWVKSLQPQV
jgi:hypothetical protein